MQGIKLYFFKTNHRNIRPEKLVIDPNKRRVLSENDYVFFQLITPKPLSTNSFIWLADFKFELILDKIINGEHYYSLLMDKFFLSLEREKFSTTFLIDDDLLRLYKIFINNFGICDIELEIDSTSERYLKLGIIEVISEKIHELDSLLSYLFEKSIFYWESISLTRNEGSELEKNQENVLWLLNKIKTIVTTFEVNFIPFLYHDKFYKLEPAFEVTPWTENITITQDSFNWIFDNLTSLEPATKYDENSFLILNRLYKAKEIASQVLNSNTNVYENQLIHGFINDINAFLISCKNVVSKRLTILITEFDFKSEIYKNYFKRLIEIIDNLSKQTSFIKDQIDAFIPVNKVVLNPTNNGRFESKRHYYDIYIHLIAWLEKKEAIHSPEILFSGTKDVSKLYEIYSLFNIIDTLVAIGFTNSNVNLSPINQFKISEDYLNQNQIQIHTVYNFENHSKQKINLHYESLPDELTTVFKTGKSGYRPDFILEFISTTGKSYYLILDSKYKKIGSIENHDYEELSFKYIHGIGPKKGGIFNLLGLVIINPIQNSKIAFYQKYPFNNDGDRTVFPLIGRVELSVGKTPKTSLQELIQYFIKFVE